MQDVTPDMLLRAYAAGIFPMADDAQANGLSWYDPPVRAVLPINHMHVAHRLRRTVRHHAFQIRINTAFDMTLERCAEATPRRRKTWINRQIRDLYSALHKAGHAHSIEVWSGSELAGGLYGVHLGAAFFGESMFSRARDVSKIALVYLVAILKRKKFMLLDCQFSTEHLTQFGVYEISREAYQAQLQAALTKSADFYGAEDGALGEIVDGFLQDVTQTS